MMRSAAAGTPARRLAPAAVALAFALTVAPRAPAEELSLAQALELAAAESPVLAAAGSRAEAAVAAARAETRSTRWPRLAVASGWTATDTPSAVFGQTLDAGLFTAGDFALDRLNTPDGRAHLGTVVTLELPLDPFGKAAPERRSATAAAEAAALAAREAVLAVRLRVIEAWHRAAVAGLAVEATARAVSAAAAREEQLAAQAAEGAALAAERLRARARRRSFEADLAARRGDERSAAAALALALGVPGPVVPDRSPHAPPEPLGELAAWLAGAERHPAVAAAGAARDAAAESARAAGRSGLPDLALGARVQDDRGPLADGQTTGMAAVTLRWSLFDPQRAARRDAAASARAAAEADLEAALDRARFGIETAYHAAVAARERWLAASGGTEEGREALRVVRERREAGLATLTDELETEAAALAAELAESAAAAEAAIARAALERAAGGPGPAAEEGAQP